MAAGHRHHVWKLKGRFAKVKKTRQVKAGNVCIGGGAPVTVQSMLNVPAHDIEGSIRQAVELAHAGCDIIRVALPDRRAVSLIPALKNAVHVPIVADIHFDYRIALEAASAGVDKIRINPGNIGDTDRIKLVADLCQGKIYPHPHRRKFRFA